MSRSIKTRELYFQSLNSIIANNTTGSWSPIGISIPENNPVFKNVVAEVYVDDNAVIAASITKRALSFNLGTASNIHVVNIGSVTNTGENISFQNSFNLTPYFTSNWSGSLMGASASFVYAGSFSGSSNYGLRLMMTYEYDITSSNQAKTIFFPVGVTNSYLSNTSSLGTFPALTQFLPESDISINQVNFIYEVNENQASGVSTDYIVGFQIGTGSIHEQASVERSNGTSRSRKYIWSTKDFNTGSSNTFTIYCSLNGNIGYCNHIYAAVDYQYNPSSSTILNSVRIPFQFEHSPNIGVDASRYIRQQVNYTVNEPGIITPTTSSLMLFNTKGVTTANINARINTSSNFFSFQSQQSSALTSYYITPITSSNGFNVQKGINTLYIDVYKSSNTLTIGSLSGLYILNYYSGNGDVNKHNKTIINHFLSNDASSSVGSTVTSLNHNIWMPESSSFFHLNSIGDEYNYLFGTFTTMNDFNLLYSKSLGEAGDQNQYAYTNTTYDAFTTGEIGNKKFYSSLDNIFKKVNLDITRNLHPTQSRIVNVVNGMGNTVHVSAATYYTYNSISFQVSGSIINSSGGTITLELYSTSEAKELQVQTRTGNGLFSFLVPNSEDQYFVIARESSNIRISSINYPVSGSFDINMAGSGLESYETFF